MWKDSCVVFTCVIDFAHVFCVHFVVSHLEYLEPFVVANDLNLSNFIFLILSSLSEKLISILMGFYGKFTNLTFVYILLFMFTKCKQTRKSKNKQQILTP